MFSCLYAGIYREAVGMRLGLPLAMISCWWSFSWAGDVREIMNAQPFSLFPSVCCQAVGWKGKRAVEPSVSGAFPDSPPSISDRRVPLPSWEACRVAWGRLEQVSLNGSSSPCKKKKELHLVCGAFLKRTTKPKEFMNFYSEDIRERAGPILFCFIYLFRMRKQRHRKAVACLSHALSHLAELSVIPDVLIT